MKGELEHDISKLAIITDLVTSKSATLDEEVKELHTELAALGPWFPHSQSVSHKFSQI